MKQFKESSLRWLYLAPTLIGGSLFLSALLVAPTDQDPTGGAGLSAALVALCSAAIALTESGTTGGSSTRRAPKLFTAIGAIAVAYLWIASEAEVHPRDPSLLLSLSILAIILVAVAMIIALIAVAAGPRRMDR